MSKVTSKLQVTVPKAIATRYGIKPGDEVEWEEAGDVIRVVPGGRNRRSESDIETRLKHFDHATRRQREREAGLDPAERRAAAEPGRGWTREEIYTRGRPR